MLTFVNCEPTSVGELNTVEDMSASAEGDGNLGAVYCK